MDPARVSPSSFDVRPFAADKARGNDSRNESSSSSPLSMNSRFKKAAKEEKHPSLVPHQPRSSHHFYASTYLSSSSSSSGIWPMSHSVILLLLLRSQVKIERIKVRARTRDAKVVVKRRWRPDLGKRPSFFLSPSACASTSYTSRALFVRACVRDCGGHVPRPTH